MRFVRIIFGGYSKHIAEWTLLSFMSRRNTLIGLLMTTGMSYNSEVLPDDRNGATVTYDGFKYKMLLSTNQSENQQCKWIYKPIHNFQEQDGMHCQLCFVTCQVYGSRLGLIYEVSLKDRWLQTLFCALNTRTVKHETSGNTPLIPLKMSFPYISHIPLVLCSITPLLIFLFWLLVAPNLYTLVTFFFYFCFTQSNVPLL